MDEQRLLDHLKDVTVALHQTRERLRELENDRREPIAVVGMACRFPGGVRSAEQLWDLVLDGGDAIGPFPDDRAWDTGRLPADCVRQGGFLRDAAAFDAEFFGISPREALTMDPQQRLLLEVSWEAIERSGMDPRSLAGTATGVFAGVSSQGYGGAVARTPGAEGYMLTGDAASVVSGRIAYVLGLEGPAVSVDTACSSSLVAIHLACQALRNGDCSLALGAGVAVMATPGVFVSFSRQGGMAANGRCKPFAAAADGTGWGEGVGVLVLERLSDAQRLGHPVLAVISGSAINQDGASNGLTAPHGPAQRRVIRQALANANLSPADIDAVEAHGTGTALGDPIEAQALLATYGQGRREPLLLGSVKSNIGHTQAAAGVAGVIKMVMALWHGTLPATLHVDEPTPHVDWTAGAARLLTEAQPWPRTGRPRRAAVSSFGVSGTNAHAVLEQAPAPEQAGAAARNGLGGMWPVSARSQDALRDQAARLAEFLGAHPESDAWDVGRALASTRTHFEHRAVVLSGDRAGLALEGPGVVRGVAVPGSRPVFVFPGQGSQWVAMAQELRDAHPVFAEQLEACAAALVPFVEWSLPAVLRDDEDAPGLDRVDVVQPALWAVMVSLARLWQSYGVSPAAVIGHSQGEIAAACVVGGLSLEDGAKVVALRGRALRKLTGLGGMASVSSAEADVRARLAGYGGTVCVAAVNGPRSVVVSGESAGLDDLLDRLADDGIDARRIPVDYAAHSRQIEQIRDELLTALAGITPRRSGIPFFSTVTGEITDTAQLRADYWYENLRQPVRFEDATRWALAQGHRVLLEVSPHPVLTLGMQQTVDATEHDAVLLATLRRGDGGPDRLRTALAHAYVAGVDLDWEKVFGGGSRVDLPTYAFQHEHYWLTAQNPDAVDVTAAGLSVTAHPLLGVAVGLADGQGVVLTGRLSLQTQPWLADHRVLGVAAVPAAVFVELAWQAGQRVACSRIDELTVDTPLVLPEKGAVRIQVRVSPDADGRHQVGIYSHLDTHDDEATWTRHAVATLARPHQERSSAEAQAWPPAGAEPIATDVQYELLAARGLDYGQAFRGLRAAWRRGDEVFAEVALAEPSDATRFGLHPALLDAALHALSPRRTSSPDRWNGMTVLATGASMLRVRISPIAPDKVSLVLADETGQLVASADSVEFRSVAADQLVVPGAVDDALFGVDWVAVSIERDTEQYLELCPDVRSLVEEVAAGAPAPETVAVVLDSLQAGSSGAVATLELIQSWLGCVRLTGSRLILVTRGAVSPDGAAPDLEWAPVWGLVRSAQSEHPDRFILLDVDDDGAAVPAGVVTAGEPQVAIRDGKVFAPRLVPRAAGTGGHVLTSAGTVLVTGCDQLLGGEIARHLVGRHGVRDLIVAGGSDVLQAELTARGARVTTVSCDVTDRDAVAEMLASIPADRPLTSVIHTDEILDDGVVQTLTAGQLAAVLDRKVAGAWHLHELTEHMPLTAFVLCSSVAAILGPAGRANYAAASAFLDALAQYRRAAGLPALSLGWGPLEDTNPATRSRLRQVGLNTLSITDAMALFDRAMATDDTVVLPVRFDRVALHELAVAGGGVPAVSRGLVRARTRRASSGAVALRHRLSTVTHRDAERTLLDLVREQAAIVLGHTDAQAIEPLRAFRDMGFDSLTAVDLRNRITALTGLRQPATLVFDHPTPTGLSRHLQAEFFGQGTSTLVVASATVLDDPVVVVGMGCRYPGGADSPEKLWDLVVSGSDAIGSFPADRGWDVDGLYDPDPDREGKSYVRQGGFLDGATQFDAEFFGISPREALAMDPQQRLLLEVSWEALERAGIDPTSLRGSQTGVFTGVAGQDYGTLVAGAPAGSQGHLLTGNLASVVSGRVAYALGLEGPAVSVDTACSSSLVALHLAAQALRGGECSLALAGGVSVMATPGVFVLFSRQRGLAADGRCKSFAAAADGTGWSEGAGVVVLERLSDARRQGHHVLAVLRGSAMNQDGASNGLAAPNGPSQQRVIRQALANSGLTPGDVDVVEAHGTGTALGDPIEAQALLATYGQDRGEPLWLGSVKSNIGHTQAAAGVAGVIKMVMALRHKALPPTLHVDEPTPHVDWATGAVHLLTQAQSWPDTGRPRRAGVSSFGVSGTNVHAILEQGPPGIPPAAGAVDGVWPLVISAKSPEALRDQAGRLRDVIGGRPDLSLADLGFSLVRTRTQFDRRAVVLAGDAQQACAGLDAVSCGRGAVNAIEGLARPSKSVFVFPGQGAQWAGMARDLLGCSAVFTEHIHACADAFAPLVDWSLLDVLDEQGTAPSLDRVDVVQPVLFAMMVSLAAVWRAHGVEPDAVAGHSQGEIAAAHVAGGLSLPDAARIVVLRSRAVRALAGRGGMLSVALGEEEIRDRMSSGDLSIAAVNGPASVVISGDLPALARLQDELTVQGVRTRRVPVDYAAHSAHVDQIRAEILDVLSGISPRSGQVPFYSSVTGELLDTAKLDEHYWYENLRRSVRFDWATHTLLEAGHRAFVEVSPHPVLGVGLQETFEKAQRLAVAVGTLRRDEGSAQRLLTSLAEAYVAGVPVDWATVLTPAGPQWTELPTYAFQRRRFWPRGVPSAGDVSAAGLVAEQHPLLGATVELADGSGLVLCGRVSLRTHPWLADHAVRDTALLPGTAFVELARHAGDRVDCPVVAELTLEAPLLLAQAGVRIQARVGAVDALGRREISVYSAADDPDGQDTEWTRHASGTVIPDDQPDDGGFDFTAWPPPGAQGVPVDGIYPAIAEQGFTYGPCFQGLRAVWRRGGETFAEVKLPAEIQPDAGSYGLHPALLDAALHALLVPGDSPAGDQESRGARLAFAWNGARLRATGASALRVRLGAAGPNAVTIAVADENGQPVATVDSLVTRPISNRQLASPRRAVDKSLFHVVWVRTAMASAAPSTPAPAVRGLAELNDLRRVLDEGAAAPSQVVLRCGPGAGSSVAPAVREVTGTTLDLVQAWLADERFEQSRLAVVTEGAVAAAEGEHPDMAWAAVWGLMRSAQTENPGRFLLIDTDAGDDSEHALPKVLAGDEPQCALRAGEILTPRMAPVPVGEPAADQPWDPSGTVLITGGTGDLGGLLARHLVGERGMRHLVLCSRRGRDVPGAVELERHLIESGADVRFVACDIADREAVAQMLARIAPEHPLKAVVHAAGAVDNGVVQALDRDRLDTVMAPKVNGAWNLHELTLGQDLTAFVVYSSIAGTLGSAGGGNYAAANAFLDAFAHHRRDRGLPGQSLAWGWWERSTGMAGALGTSQQSRLQRTGIVPMASDEGLALFDVAGRAGEPVVVPARISMPALRDQAASGTLPPLLRGLVRVPRSGRVGVPVWQRLRGLPEDQQAKVLVDVVRTQVALVLGHPDAEPITADQGFLDAGFDSLTAVDLRNRLNALTGLPLPTTVVFDHPSPAALAAYLHPRIVDRSEPPEPVAQEPLPPSNHALDQLYRQACVAGKVLEATELLMVASRIRETFTDPDAVLRRADPVPLGGANGAGKATIVCFPSLSAISGAHEFIRFGSSFMGRRDLLVLPQIGFVEGEPLPSCVGAAVDLQIEAMDRRNLTTGDCVLMGVSSGGWMTRAVAERLTALGRPPAAVVLLDTYLPNDLYAPDDGGHAGAAAVVASKMLDAAADFGGTNDTRFSAMGGYFRIFRQWQPGEIPAPTLFVRPADFVIDDPDGPWQARWPEAHESVEVPGDHFSMFDTHATSTAEAVEQWLLERGVR